MSIKVGGYFEYEPFQSQLTKANFEKEKITNIRIIPLLLVQNADSN